MTNSSLIVLQSTPNTQLMGPQLCVSAPRSPSRKILSATHYAVSRSILSPGLEKGTWDPPIFRYRKGKRKAKVWPMHPRIPCVTCMLLWDARWSRYQAHRTVTVWSCMGSCALCSAWKIFPLFSPVRSVPITEWTIQILPRCAYRVTGVHAPRRFLSPSRALAGSWVVTCHRVGRSTAVNSMVSFEGGHVGTTNWNCKNCYLHRWAVP